MKTIVCSYKNDIKFGFGDFLRGSCNIRNECLENELEFQIDYSKHEIGKYVKSKYSGPSYSDDQIKVGRFPKKTDLEEHFQENDYYYLCSNQINTSAKKPFKLLDTVTGFSFVDSAFFIDNLNFCDSIKQEVEKKLSDNNIKEFNIIQARIGDEYCFSNGMGFLDDKKITNNTPFYVGLNDLAKIFLDLISKNNTRDNVIISDSSEFKQKMKNLLIKKKVPKCYVLTLESTHTSREMIKTLFEKPKSEGLRETMMEMYMLCLASEIISVSSYHFTSSFVNSIASFFKIPIRNLKALRYLELNI